MSAPAESEPAFAVNIVDVEVDPETGKVQILRYTALQDAGKAVHPSYVEGQMQGGVVQGIGWALNEEYYFDERGHMANSSFLDYRMPTSLDLPMIDTVIVEVANPGPSLRSQGCGRDSPCPPHGCFGQRHPRCRGHQNEQAAYVPWQCAGDHLGE